MIEKNCEHCNKPFFARADKVRKGLSRFCSKHCAHVLKWNGKVEGEICSKMVFVKALGREKPCMREVGHGGPNHTPDLLGEKFGELTVVRLGEIDKRRGASFWTWIVNFRGREKQIRANHLISGNTKGFSMHHGFSNRDGKLAPEYETVRNHHHNIFHSSSHAHKSYKGMPFHDDWNNDAGGELWRGAKWIIDNLGKKPGPDWTMDVIEHAKGFIPGNLRWALHRTQSRNKQHRVLGQYSEEEFAIEAKRRGYVKKE